MRELDARVNAFLQSDFYTLRVHEDPDSGDNILEFRQDTDLPSDIPLVIGDVVHNLRSALDILWTAMIRALGGNDAHDHFPIDKLEDRLRTRLATGIMAESATAITGWILDELQPYKGGRGHAIWALNQLNRADKHRLLIATAYVTELRHVSAIDENQNMLSDCTLAVGPRGVLRAFVSSARLRITDAGQPRFEMRFAEPPLKGQAILPTLDAMCKTSKEIVEKIGALWSAIGS